MVVYKITNLINNKVYIGVTKNKLKTRWNRHLRDCNYGSQFYLYKAMRKYGTIHFKIECIDDSAKTIEELGEKEKYYIQKYKSNNSDYGYNSDEGRYMKNYETSGKSLITNSDVVFIRTKYNDCILRCKECWKKYFQSKISFSGFQKIWEGTTWKGIMDEVYSDENINKHKQQLGHKGFHNYQSILTSEEVLEIRKFYVNHTLKETYEMYGKQYKTIESFSHIVRGPSYLFLPIYQKYKKCWILDNKIINIEEYNPVSTISESGE